MSDDIQYTKLTIDGREVVVPVGTGLVEAAAAVGIEIPVFCYEPRLGAPVGACRMCLVEVEGARGLQAACACTANEGMVVSTVSDAAREAQEAVLEFLLINHPLDCPVCDKGGECPLQDQTFRWGPGASRFGELKRNNDKPIPVSPLIALDRERCILCYRCTRFSSDVSEDTQLISRERGANTVIATFEGRPYTGHFSGNIIELCPVGALTSTEFRFKARQWDATDHPTVCTLCPVGCNTWSTMREGEVVRMLARENTDVDNGWLCDRGRFSYTSLQSDERILAPYERPGRGRPAGNRPSNDLSHELAMEWLHERLADTSAAALWVLSGSETVEEAYAALAIAGQTGGRVVALDGGSAAAPRAAATLGDVPGAKHILIVGDADLADTAPMLDLRVREAMRGGAHVTIVGAGGTRLEAGGAKLVVAGPDEHESAAREVAEQVRQAAGGGPLTEPGIVIFTDGELSPETLDALALAFHFPRERSGFIAIPAAANARGLAALGIEPVGLETIADHTGGLVLVGVEPSRHFTDEQWRPAVRSCAWVAATAMFHTPITYEVDLVIPATGFQEKDGTTVNLEGRLQRMTVGAAPRGGIKPELSWLAGLGRRLGANVPGHSAGAYRVAAAAHAGAFPAATHGDIPEGGLLGVTATVHARPATPAAVTPREGELVLHVAPFLYDGVDVEHARSMDFLRAQHVVTMSREDVATRNLSRGDDVLVTIDGTDYCAIVQPSRRITPGHARVLAGTCGLPAGHTGYHAAQVTAAPAPAPVPASVAASAAPTAPEEG